MRELVKTELENATSSCFCGSCRDRFCNMCDTNKQSGWSLRTGCRARFCIHTNSCLADYGSKPNREHTSRAVDDDSHPIRSNTNVLNHFTKSLIFLTFLLKSRYLSWEDINGPHLRRGGRSQRHSRELCGINPQRGMASDMKESCPPCLTADRLRRSRAEMADLCQGCF